MNYKETYQEWLSNPYFDEDTKKEINEEEKNILRKTPLIFACDESQKCCPLN